MKICHITTVHPAKDARIYYRMCSALAAKGFQVTLIASEPFVDEHDVRSSPWNDRIKRAGRINKIFVALRAALSEDFDIYHFHDPELIPLGLALKILRPSKSVIYDVHEDYPSMMLEKYWLPKPLRPLVSKAAGLANNLASLCLDGVVTADPGVYDDFGAVAKDKSIVYYNFPLLNLFDHKTAEPAVDLVYVGGMSERTGIFVLIDALASLAARGLRPSVRLAGYTDGDAGRRAIEDRIKSEGLSAQIEMRGRIAHTEVPDWIRSGRVGLVLLQPIPKFTKNIPSKLFEYWACGRPVIASDLPPIRPFFSENNSGVLFSPADSESLARAIEFTMTVPSETARMGQYGQEQVLNKWNNDTQTDNLVSFYKRISKR